MRFPTMHDQDPRIEKLQVSQAALDEMTEAISDLAEMATAKDCALELISTITAIETARYTMLAIEKALKRG